MSEEEVLEVTKIYSVAGLLSKENPIISSRPFRSPHHTASGISLVGGGKTPRPGEISLAHRGVLFLDEFPEFPRTVLENLRQPLEDGLINISRVQGTLSFPARFSLIASQNPCPCGYFQDPEKACLCTNSQILKYQKKVSGPILDRIDLFVQVPRLNYEKMADSAPLENSKSIRDRVESARKKQTVRFASSAARTNSEMRPQEIKQFCQLESKALSLLKSAVNEMHLSGRSFHHILKISRTIADLADSPEILLPHVAEALQYRNKN
jgi:magnesium chelatase family protein